MKRPGQARFWGVIWSVAHLCLTTCKDSVRAYHFSLRLMTESRHELLVKSGFLPVLCLSEPLKALNLAGRLSTERDDYQVKKIAFIKV